MNDQKESEDGDRSEGENGARLKLKGIVETPELGDVERRERARGVDRRTGPERRGGRWKSASRQTMFVARLGALFFLFAVLVGWPAGHFWAFVEKNGSREGWSYFDVLGLDSFILAVLIPVLILLIGYNLSRQQQMMAAADEIAAAARKFIHPDKNAAERAVSVGTVMRGQMEALNVGLDGALNRLASVEAMIRQHVAAIEEAGDSIETRASGAVGRVAVERARLIELTERLNVQADAFAAAIAAKAQASIDALSSADDIAERAESHLEERLSRLDAAAQQALQSFHSLGEALHSADDAMRASTGSIETTAAETRAATERAVKASEAAAESVARNAANVGAMASRASQDSKRAADEAIEQVAASSRRASEEARKAADEAIAIAGQEAERASRSAFQAAEREARRVADTAGRVLSDVRKSTNEVLNAVATDAGKAAKAATQMSEAARLSAEAAAHASANVAKASADAHRNAEAALAMAEKTTARIDERNKALMAARAALEQENARLEGLIEEQRKRADRLAEAIASQTERLSKLAESQLREQEAGVRLAEAQLALQKKSEDSARAEAARAAAQMEAAEMSAREREAVDEASQAAAAAAAEKARLEAALADAKSGGEDVEPLDAVILDLGKAARKEPKTKAASAQPSNGTRRRPAESAPAADEAAARKKAKTDRRDPPVTLGAADLAASETEKRDKQSVSWREILDATDEAEPLDLAAATVKKPQAERDGAANAIKIISELQTFTFDLETRLYGDPPQSLRERFEHGDRNVFANRLLRLNETDVKRRIRMESGRDKAFERDIHDFLQGFERLLEDATTSETADEDLEEYLSSPLGRIYLLIGATVGYFA